MEERFKKGLYKFLTQSKVFDMLPISSELLVIDDKLSVQDYIDILVENNKLCSLIIDSSEHAVTDIILPVDLYTILVQLKQQQKQGDLLLQVDKMTSFLSSLSLKSFLQIYKYFQTPRKQIVSINMKTNLKKIIEVFKNEKIGHIIVKNQKHPEKEFFAVLTKQDFLLYILKSYRANSEEKNFLEQKLSDMNIPLVKPGKEVKVISENQTLFEALQLIVTCNITMVPIVSTAKKYKGFLIKSFFFLLMQKKLYHLLDQPVIQFYEYLISENLILKSYQENLFFSPDNTLFEIFRKFIYTHGQILFLENGEIQGLISLHDMFDSFL